MSATSSARPSPRGRQDDREASPPAPGRQLRARSEAMMWRLKILIKILLSRIPFGYWTWRRLGIFRHGDMHRDDYAFRVVMTHVDRVGRERLKGAVCLELGPGDSLASAVIARSLGARKVYLVDVGDFADRNIETYRAIASGLSRRGLPAPDLSKASSFEGMLSALGAVYLTEGLASLRQIENASVDFIWSHAVLEHIRLREIRPMFRELHRIMRRPGIMSHRIDFQDHLGGSLNNLRFSERVWESEFMVKSGFYTNRMRVSQMLGAMEEAGFETTAVELGEWDRLPLPRARLAPPFRGLADLDLLTKHVDVVACPAEPR
jgi:SAM-dependent methyltransferase